MPSMRWAETTWPSVSRRSSGYKSGRSTSMARLYSARSNAALPRLYSAEGGATWASARMRTIPSKTLFQRHRMGCLLARPYHEPRFRHWLPRDIDTHLDRLAQIALRVKWDRIRLTMLDRHRLDRAGVVPQLA